jgi:hypothetical protein
MKVVSLFLSYSHLWIHFYVIFVSVATCWGTLVRGPDAAGNSFHNWAFLMSTFFNVIIRSRSAACFCCRTTD